MKPSQYKKSSLERSTILRSNINVAETSVLAENLKKDKNIFFLLIYVRKGSGRFMSRA
jgi:hypothetical protein